MNCRPTQSIQGTQNGENLVRLRTRGVQRLLLLAMATQANAAACSSPYVKGDVFASVGNSTVDVF